MQIMDYISITAVGLVIVAMGIDLFNARRER